MLVLTGCLLLGARSWYRAEYGKYLTSQPISWTIAEREELPLPSYAREYGVQRIDVGYDAERLPVAYILETVTAGYHDEIAVESVIRADGELLAEITVLRQNESRYYGARIAEPSFKERFSGRYLPIRLSTDTQKGTHIDALSGATVSSAAVVDAVNAAYDCLRKMLTEVKS